MGTTPTLITAGLAALAALLFGLAGLKPYDPLKGPRMVPFRALMLAAFVVMLLMLVHLANLAGVSTGR